MSFILLPSKGDDVKVNAWNWRPTIQLLRDANLIDERQHELMSFNGGGGAVSSDTANEIAEFLEQRLSQMIPGQRIRSDLTVSGDPKEKVVFTPSTKVEDIDAVDLYSATYEWLVMFRDFCRASGGFKVS